MNAISDLTVVVPCHNEAHNLLDSVLAADSVLRGAAGEVQWVLVDDGSTDTTADEIQALCALLPRVTAVSHDSQRGLGAAIWTGLSRATSEWCTWMPADGQVEPQSMADMIPLAEESGLVILMRIEHRRTMWRRLLTMGLYVAMRLILGFDPYGYSGVFLAHRSLIEDLPLQASTAVQNYAVVLHAIRRKCRVVHVSTTILPRKSGKSKVANLPTMLKTLYEILKLRFVQLHVGKA